jgi:hypothetical protein
MQPASIVHDEPERGRLELAQIGDDQREHAFDAFVVQGPGKMMVVNEVVVTAGT